MARLLVVEPVAQPAVDVLTAAHETDLRVGIGRDELLDLLAEGGGYDALIVRSQTRVDAELLAAGAPRLSVVGVASVGIDRIDVEAATRAGVMIVNAPTGNTIAAAEHTMALMLALLRHVPDANASIRAGEWERARYTGHELRGKTLGIIGLGKIGKAVARRATGFEMRVIATDPYLTEEQASEAGARLVGLAELLHRSDVITVHTPLTPQTRNLLGRPQLEATRPGAFVLNVARGGIVDERALADAVDSGHLAGAAVDVYSTEPMEAGNPLRAVPNVLLTPHLGASTAEAQDRVGLEMAEQVLMALAGVTPPYAVNAPAVAPETAPKLRRAGPAPGDPRAAARSGRLRRPGTHVRGRDRGR
jgi:D-3-phosphoglycerate dehydrogenase